MKRLLFVAAVAALMVLSCPARSEEKPAKPASAAAVQAPALTPEQTALYVKLQRLSQIEGNPPWCCNGVTVATTTAWAANPPSSVVFSSTETELVPPQPWTRPCKAWAILP
jgi:hypothetical protein